MSQKSFGNNIFKEYIPKLGLWSKTMRTVLCAINILYGWNCIFTVRQPKFSPEATVLQLSLPSRNKTTRYFKHHYFCFTLISYFSHHYHT